MDWFDVLAVQGTLKTLLQHRSSNNGQYLLEYFINKVRAAKYFIDLIIWSK